jgi:hypothetical protein
MKRSVSWHGEETRGAVRQGKAIFRVPAPGGASRFVVCGVGGGVGGGSSSSPWRAGQRGDERDSWTALARADAPAQRASCRAARLTVVRQQRPCAQGAPQKRSEGRGRVSGGE